VLDGCIDNCDAEGAQASDETLAGVRGRWRVLHLAIVAQSTCFFTDAGATSGPGMNKETFDRFCLPDLQDAHSIESCPQFC
jgi:hypothetical protein